VRSLRRNIVKKYALVVLCVCLTVSVVDAKETAKPTEKVEIKKSTEDIKPTPAVPTKDSYSRARVEISVQDVEEFYVDLVITVSMPCCSEKDLPPIDKTDQDSTLLHRYLRAYNQHFSRAYHYWLNANETCRVFSIERTATRTKQFPVAGGTTSDFEIPVGGTVRCACPDGHDGHPFGIEPSAY
jgi:hypothetical protein